MSKLEPTRTSSDLTATEHLRRMLDERGVEWHDTKIGKGFITVFEHDGITWIATEHSSGRLSVKGCVKPTQGHYDGMTPEQAIAATLGDAPYLPHFWTHDGVLHVELPKLPESISVRLPDQRDREVGSARVWQYTRDSGTCQKVYLVETSDDLIESWHPIGVYLSSKVAGDCAEALRGEVDGIRQFARVVELKVVDE